MASKYVYPYSYNEANQTGDLDSYQESFDENVRCAEFIKKTIDENYDGYRLNKDIAKPVIAEFGYSRVNYVLANTMQELKSDGRFSRQNKEWADKTYIPKNKVYGLNMNAEFIVTSHPAVLNGFINQARDEYQKLNLWEYTHCNDKTHLDFTDKVMVLHPDQLKDEYKTPKEQLILCSGGFGCNPSSSGRKVYGTFLSDGEKCQYNRSDFIGELKSEHLPDWAKEKLQEMQSTSAPTMGEIEMT